MDETVVVSADWLAARLDEPGVRVVDVREPWEYGSIGHVPGAVNVPFDAFRSADDSTEGMLPGADVWATLMSEAGVEADDTLVAYDDTHGVFAARFLVTAMLYGHRDLHLLDGDYSSWMREHETTTDAPAVEPTTYGIREAAHSPLVGREAVEAAIDDPDAVLVDTRTPEEFAAGHIPGAVNLDWLALVDDESRGLKSRAEIEAILEEVGVTREKRVVLYCNTARRISHTYVVLRWLGYDPDFYEGSLTEWTRVGGEMETGEG